MGRFAVFAALLALVLPSVASAAAPPPPPASEAELRAEIERISRQLHPVTGDVAIPGANAVLYLGDDYYFLPANEARIVLTEAWGNPAEAAGDVLGLIFPAGKTFADDTWGAVVTYEASGYVSDSDASAIDYGELLGQMQSGEEEVNAERSRRGFPAQHLVGWAQSPTYDAGSHSLVWARNIQFMGETQNSLNYDIRLLGRRGVLSLNMVTVMSKLDETRAAAAQLARTAQFNQGERYADYQPGTDRVAEYGIAGLITAGLGAAVAKKAGLLALILAFGKKIIIFLIAGIALLWSRIRGLFGGKAREDEAAAYYEAPPEAPAVEPATNPAQTPDGERPPT